MPTLGCHETAGNMVSAEEKDCEEEKQMNVETDRWKLICPPEKIYYRAISWTLQD